MDPAVTWPYSATPGPTSYCLHSAHLRVFKVFIYHIIIYCSGLKRYPARYSFGHGVLHHTMNSQLLPSHLRCMSCRRMQPLFALGRCRSLKSRWFPTHCASSIVQSRDSCASARQQTCPAVDAQRHGFDHFGQGLRSQRLQHRSIACMAATAEAPPAAQQSAAEKAAPIPLPTSDESDELLRIRHSVSSYLESQRLNTSA